MTNPNPKKTTRSETEIADRRRQVADLYLHGKTTPAIGILLGVAHSTVSKDLKALRKLWVQEAILSINEIKAAQLAKLDAIEEAAWDAWTRSLLPFNKTVTERSGDEELPQAEAAGPQRAAPPNQAVAIPRRRMRAQVVRADKEGNPSFLILVTNVIRLRCEILGVTDPLAHDDTHLVIEVVRRGHEADPITSTRPLTLDAGFKPDGANGNGNGNGKAA